MQKQGNGLMIKCRVAQTLIVISGVFLLTVLSLLTATFIRTRAAEPLDASVLSELRVSTVRDATDERLQAEYRAIDLLARRAHFTSLSVYRSGALLLLGAGIVFVLSLKYLASLRAALPDPGRYPKIGSMGDPLAFSRRAVVGSGIALLLAAVGGIVLFRSTGPDRVTLKKGTQDRGPTNREALLKNWPGFRGVDGLGIAYDVNPPATWDGAAGKNIRWKTKVPRPGFSSAIVWDGKVVVTGADADVREVYCFDADTGVLKWRHAAVAIAGSPEEAPEVAQDTGYAAATAATDGKRVYAIFATGDLVALDLNGNRAWARNLGVPDNPYGHASSLIIHDGLLFVQLDDNKGGRLLALRAETGETIWEKIRETLPSWASPILVQGQGGAQLILNGNPHVTAYDARQGTERWSMECLGGEVAPSPAWDDGLVFTGCEYASLVAIAPGDPPERIWEVDEELPEVSSPVAWHGLLFVATSSGIVTCRDTKTGQVRWEHEFDEGFYASPVVAAERVYLMSREGVTHVFRAADRYEALGSSPLGEKADASPAFVGRRVYIRGTENLYCMEAL